MDRTAHARGTKIRRLLQGEGNELNSQRQLLPVQQMREFNQSCHTARVIVSPGEWASSIVMSANDDSLRCLWSKLSSHVSIALAVDAVRLFRNDRTGVAKLALNVSSDSIEVLEMIFIARN